MQMSGCVRVCGGSQVGCACSMQILVLDECFVVSTDTRGRALGIQGRIRIVQDGVFYRGRGSCCDIRERIPEEVTE